MSLSSAEAELNALVAAAADGIYIRRCLELLVEEEIVHDCLVDNSAASQLSHKRGPGKLCHIDGKLLWIQDRVAQKELNVKAVGVAYNVADLGTKPLTRARINLILHWCHNYDGQGHRLGEEEHERFQEETISRGKIQRLAKFLHRIIVLGSLEQVAGERVEAEVNLQAGSETGWLFILTLFLCVVVVVLCGVIYKLWRRLLMVEDEIIEIKEGQKVDGMMIGAYGHESQEQVQMVRQYAQRIHRGLIKASGYVDADEVEPGDWLYWDYAQKSNRETSTTDAWTHKSTRTMRKKVPESEEDVEEDVDMAMPEAGSESAPASRGQIDPTMNQATTARISEGDLECLRIWTNPRSVHV